jgi:hypothetical protein
MRRMGLFAVHRSFEVKCSVKFYTFMWCTAVFAYLEAQISVVLLLLSLKHEETLSSVDLYIYFIYTWSN